MTSDGVWIGNWICVTLKTYITTNDSHVAHNTFHYSTHLSLLSLLCLDQSLPVTDLNNVDFLASVFTSLPATNCLIAPHGRISRPLTPSHVWPPLATTHCHRQAFIFDAQLVCLKAPITLRLAVHLAVKPTEAHDQRFFFCNWTLVVTAARVLAVVSDTFVPPF
jgi:hypothetical protein